MKEQVARFFSLFGAAIAAACCLGVPVILSAVGAVGLGFLIQDAYLFPIFVGFIGLSLWTLYLSARRHKATVPEAMLPLWLSGAGALVSTAGLWFTVTGISAQNWAVYLGLILFLIGAALDFFIGRKAKSCAEAVCEPESEQQPPEIIDGERRMITGAAISVAAAGVFYGLYQSVDAYAPKAEEGDIACWGINSCKGTTACSTAFNACNGQNACRGKGYIYVPEKECFARGGKPLEGSAGDPARS